jgi:hypothetical protein
MAKDRVSRCECGRPWSQCIYVVQRSGTLRLIHYRCTACSREWTVREEGGTDLAEPVSTDEVIRVHELLVDDDALAELFKG